MSTHASGTPGAPASRERFEDPDPSAPRDPLYPRDVLGRPEVGEDRPAGPARRAGGTVRLLFDAWRRRTVTRRLLMALSVLGFLVGVGMFVFPFATNWYADWKQGQLATEFRSEETREAYLQRTIPPGSALTRIEIPSLGVDAIVVEGTSLPALRAGAGHYEGTPLPCESGNASIAGHRTTYSKPFARLDELVIGDRIVLETPVGRCTYQVVRTPFVTHPADWAVISELDGFYLTLTTCHPEGSARERLIVRARLISAD
ncbi:MAG: sortase [Actinomycetota bacterium]